MTMLITKFHKLIQNKILWLVFLVFIVFSFVIWGTQIPSRDDMRSQAAPGLLDGKPIDRKEFEQARYGEYLALVMAAGQAIPFGQLQEELTPLTWRRLVSLQEAERLGLMASNVEVVESLKEQPLFSPDGRFDPQAYRNFVQGYLGSLLQANIPMSYFEEHVRKQLSLGKLQRMIQQTVLVTPFEVDQGLRIATDAFRAAYVVVRDGDIGEAPDISREEARAHFDQDPAAFTIPPMVRVKYVAIEAADFLDGTEVDVAEVDAYYTDNIEDFATEAVTNDMEAAAESATNSVEIAAEPATTFRPLEEVRDGIEGILRRKQALTLAVDTAGDFVYELMPDRDGNAPKFTDLAAERGLTIQEPDPFMETGEVPELGEASAEFVTQAFQLEPNREEYVSNPIRGEETAYVLALVERIPERIPTFDEVETNVTAAAQAAAAEEAVMVLAREVQAKVRAAAAEGQAMTKALEDTKLSVVKTEKFSFSEGLSDDAYANFLRLELTSLNPSEVSELIPVYDGIMVAQVLERTPEDALTREAYNEQMIRGLSQDYAARIYPAWQDQLLREAQFEDLDAARIAAAEAAEAAEGTEADEIIEEEQPLYDDE